ncbi:MAG: PulJ/GspJ family protein [Planctomycetota bacterium]
MLIIDSQVAGRRAKGRGFTLIELLLVLMISSILVLGINAAYRQAHAIWSNVEDQRQVYHDARLITETLRQEFSCLYFPPKSEQEDANEPFELSETTLAFYTFTPSWKASLGASRIARVRYTLSNDPDTDETLLRRYEQPCAGEKLIGKETSDVVANGLSGFNVSASGQESKGDDESGQRPPKALTISLTWPATKRAPELNLVTTILVPAQEALEAEQGPEAGDEQTPAPS